MLRAVAAPAARLGAQRRGRVRSPEPRVRVLHVISSLTVGGAERLVVSAARGLSPDRFDHQICCLSERGPLADEAAAAGIPVFCIGTFPGLSHPVAFARLLALIRRARPRVVHTHLQAANLYGRLAAWLAQVPVLIATEHNVYVGKPRRYVVVERWLARETDVLIAVSENVRRFLAEQLGVPPATVRVVRNGAAALAPSSARIAELRARLERAGARPVVATVASLTAKKGHAFLFEAVARLRSQNIACTLVLAGEGPERQRLQATMERLGLTEFVHFLGSDSDVGSVLAVADLIVLPSVVEGLPLALLEAMLAGKPVVATAVGGIPEVIVSGDNGLLVPPCDEAALADAIERVLQSPEVGERIGARGRCTVQQHFTEAAYLRSLEAIYTEAVQHAR